MKNILVFYKESISCLIKKNWMSESLQTTPSLKLGVPKYVLLFGLSVFLCFLNVNGDNRAILCIVKAPLDTPFFSFFEEKNSTCLGCLFSNLNNSRQEKGIQKYKSVEVIETSSNSVELVINLGPSCVGNSDDDFASVFLLVSKKGHPANFTISQRNTVQECKFIFVACDNVTVLMEHKIYDVMMRPEWNSENVLHRSTEEFGFVTSYTNSDTSTKVVRNADQNYSRSSEQSCTKQTREFSPIATCSILSKQVISGCYYQNRIGQSSNDVHIIDVNHQTQDSRQLLILVNGIDTDMDLLSTGAIDSYDNKKPLKRNLTLVICSKQPISLTVNAKNIDGIITLLVGGNDQVENISPAENNLTVTVKKVALPKSFDLLLLYVLSTIGLPISYVRSTSPSVIKMLVASTDAVIENTEDMVKSSMVVECLDNQVLVSVPRSVAEKAGVVAMSLSDPSCFSKTNETHVFLTSKFNSCGFYLQSSVERTVYSNVVYVDIGKYSLFESDDEDFTEGSGMDSDFPMRSSQIRTVVQCNFQEQYTSKEDFPGDYNYKMALFKDEKYSVQYNDIPVIVPPKSFVHVELSFLTKNTFNDDTNLRLLVEECWLSSSRQFILNPQTLIRKSCAVQPFVSIHIPYVSQNLHFQFKLSETEYHKEAQYLYCEIGICSTNSLPRPSIVKCVDPRSYCGKENLLTAFTHQFIMSKRKTIVAGPLIVSNFTIRSPLENGHSGSSHSHGYGQFGDRNSFFGTKQQPSIIVVEGLSTEAVVGIAILSFILGIGLMGTLWFIYTKTDPGQHRRQQSNATIGRNYEIDANSGSSTPSSEVPMSA